MESKTLKGICSALLMLCLLIGTVYAEAPVRGHALDAQGVVLTEEFLTDARLGALADEALAAGSNVQLTLDSALQKAAEDALAEAFASEPFLIGAVVVMDMEGRVLALADNLAPDSSKTRPHALGVRATPGRTLLPLTALAALTNGAITVDEEISDEGSFDLYDTANPPTCWIEASRIKNHAHQTVVEALHNCCDYYFYTAASRMGPEKWVNLAQELGLDSLSGIGLPGELLGLLASPKTLFDPNLPVDAHQNVYPAQVRALLIQHLRLVGQSIQITPSEEALEQCADALMRMAVEKDHTDWVSSIRDIMRQHLSFAEETVYLQFTVGPIYIWLNSIKWGGMQTIEAAVGRSFTEVTPIAMARYWTALANGGYLYNAQILSGDTKPEPVLDLSNEFAPYLPAIRQGLHGVIDITGSSAKVFREWRYRDKIASMAATAELPWQADGYYKNDATWMAGFAPYEKPEITVVVFVPRMYDTKTAATIFCTVMDQYLSR